MIIEQIGCRSVDTFVVQLPKVIIFKRNGPSSHFLKLCMKNKMKDVSVFPSVTTVAWVYLFPSLFESIYLFHCFNFTNIVNFMCRDRALSYTEIFNVAFRSL